VTVLWYQPTLAKKKAVIEYYGVLFIHLDIHFNFPDKAIAIQLRGPESSNGTGRVEVFHNKQWGTICRDGWDMQDTDVVCRELGFKYSIKTLSREHVPRGTGPIWLSKVACRGNEEHFSDCLFGGFGNNSCGHRDDVGVECSSTGNVEIKKVSFYFLLPVNTARVCKDALL